ncbi:MAG: hypothetical protein ABIG11_01295 [bacterium]
MHESGSSDVEVVNFGVSGFGFHQTFAFWENEGKKYGLDYVLVGPGAFFWGRDSSFNPTFMESYLKGIPEYLHSRYILKRGGAKLVEVAGETHEERVRAYFSFIPRVRYLLYDSEAPAFLRAPLAFFFPNRKLIRNPLYYKRDLNAEKTVLYRILLSKMADSAPRVIVGTDNLEMAALAAGIGRDNLSAVSLSRPVHFPYFAFGKHNSPLGNEIVARQMFDAISGKQNSELVIIRTKDVSPKEFGAEIGLKKRSLGDYRKIELVADGMRLGQFYDTKVSPVFYCAGKDCEPAVKTFEGVKSIISIKNGGENILDSAFLPLDFELAAGMPVKLRFRRGSSVAEQKLGSIKMLRPNLNIAWMALDCRRGLAYNTDTRSIEMDPSDIPYPDADSRRKGTLITFLLGDVPLMSARQPEGCDRLRFKSSQGSFIIIRGDGRMTGGERRLPESGTIYLSLYGDAEKPVRIPFAGWFKTRLKTKLRG